MTYRVTVIYKDGHTVERTFGPSPAIWSWLKEQDDILHVTIQMVSP